MPDVKFHYIKSPFHQEIKVDGAIGGIDPTAQGITFSVYTERHPIPRVVVHEMVEVEGNGMVLGEENLAKREVKDGYVRTIGATLHLTPEQAISIHDWLGKHIDALKKGTGEPK